jgi:enamine deaminase RidA (YjgF/YER057c/UK114 family)
MAQGFDPAEMMKPFGAFSQGAWQPEGRMLQISGQVSVDANSEIIGRGDIAAQTRQTLHNIETILRHAGGGFDDIVSVIVYVTEMDGLDKIHEVRREFFRPPYPASTLVQVAGLVWPDLLIEISAGRSSRKFEFLGATGPGSLDRGRRASPRVCHAPPAPVWLFFEFGNAVPRKAEASPSAAAAPGFIERPRFAQCD